MRHLWYTLIILCLTTVLQAQSETDKQFFVRFEHSVYFETAKFNVDSIDQKAIFTIQRLLKKYPADEIRLEGRADYRGGTRYNDRLSAQRSSAVADYLVSKGFADSLFREEALGERFPLAMNRDSAGLQQNRSVRILIGQNHEVEWITGRLIVDSTGNDFSSTIFIGNKLQQRAMQIDEDGYFRIPVPRNGLISVEAYSCTHYLAKRFYDLRSESGDLGDLHLSPLVVETAFDFEDILFIGNRDIVLPEYRPNLDNLLNVVRSASCVHFEIEGHINLPNNPPQDTTTWHYDLSLRRARRIYEFLIDNNVAPDRLTYNGYSNWRMKFPHAIQESKQRQNRRVTLRVTRVDLQ